MIGSRWHRMRAACGRTVYTSCAACRFFACGFRVMRRWEGKCWYYYNQLKYEFDLEFEVNELSSRVACDGNRTIPVVLDRKSVV